MKASLIFSILCALMAVYGLYTDATGQVEDGATAAIVFAIAAVLLWLKYRKNRKQKTHAKAPAKKPAAKKPATAAAAPVQVKEPAKVVAPVRVEAPAKVEMPVQVEVPDKVVAPAQVEAPAEVDTPVTAKAEAKKTPKVYITVYKGKVKGTAAVQARQKALAWLKEQEAEGESLLFSLEKDEYKGQPSIKVMVETLISEKPARHIGFIAAEDVEKVLPYVYMNNAFVDGTIYGGEDGKNYGAAVEISITRELNA